MTRFVCILSGKGGVAKTTTTVNLGAALNHFGRDVTIIDGNLTTPNLGLHLGIPTDIISLHDVLKGKHNILKSVYQHSSGLKIIPGSLSLSHFKKTKFSNFSKVLPSLSGLTDVVLIDCAPGLGDDVFSVVKAVDDVVVVTNPELPAVADALKIVKLVEKQNKNIKGIVLTKTGLNHDINFEDIKGLMEKDIIANIPYDKSIRESLFRKEPVVYSHPKSKSAVAYKKLAADLIGVEYNEKVSGKVKTFFSSLFKR